MAKLSDILEALAEKDVAGHLADAVQDKMRTQFGVVITTQEAVAMVNLPTILQALKDKDL